MKKKIITAAALIITVLLIFCSCAGKTVTGESGTAEESTGTAEQSADENAGEAIEADTSGSDGIDFAADEKYSDASYDKNSAVSITANSETGKTAGIDSITITSGGTYIISAKITGKMITVDAGSADVRLVLSGARISNANGPAIYVRQADNVIITLEGENIVSDGSGYSVTDGETDLDAAIFSKDDLIINGSGSLSVTGGTKHGIVSKDDLVIAGSSLTVSAQKAGINGKDSVKISSANINVTAGSDGIRSDNSEDSAKGFIGISGSTLNINAGNDGIQAQTAVKLEDCDVTVKTASGSSQGLVSAEESYKGIKAGSDIIITGGTLTADTRDDSVHSNGTVSISGGTLSLSSGDDGIHADNDLAVTGGTVTVSKSYEGLEAEEIKISGGKISVTASDDGLNAAGGADSSAQGERFGRGGFASSNGTITVTGGYIYIDAGGDGVDSNGTFTLSGGTVLVNGPADSGNAAMDAERGATVTGGTMVALGSAGMAQNFTSAENQGAILVSFSNQGAGTFAVNDESGKVVVSMNATKTYGSALVTAPGITESGTYSIVAGGSLDGADAHGYATGGTLSGGTELTKVTMTSSLYTEGGGMGPGGMMRGGGNFNPQDGGNFNPQSGEGFEQGGNRPQRPGGENSPFGRQSTESTAE